MRVATHNTSCDQNSNPPVPIVCACVIQSTTHNVLAWIESLRLNHSPFPVMFACMDQGTPPPFLVCALHELRQSIYQWQLTFFN
jgi:hypothetical protein